MPKYIIERSIPGAGDLSPEALQSISQKSCSILKNLGPQIQWIESYVVGPAKTLQGSWALRFLPKSR
jgi:hypothetical protein